MEEDDDFKEIYAQRLSGLLNQENNKVICYFHTTEGVRKANIQNRFDECIIAEIESFLKQSLEKLEDEDFSIMPISRADDRKKTYYIWDIEGDSPIKEPLSEIAGRDDIADFDINDVDKLIGFIFRYGTEENFILTYRRFFKLNLFKHATRLLFFSQDNQLEKLDKDIIQIDGKIDYIHFSNPDQLFLLDTGALEKDEAFVEKIKYIALYKIGELARKSLIENESLHYIKEQIVNLSSARKIINVVDSELMNNLTPSALKGFINSIDKLKGLFSFSKKDRVILKSKKASKQIIEVLNDDIYKSSLTNILYRTRSKDKF